MADVAAGAARVVDELPAADRAVAKRLLLRMVQLRPDEPVFDPVPAPLPVSAFPGRLPSSKWTDWSGGSMRPA